MNALLWILVIGAVLAIALSLAWWTRRVVPPTRGRRPAPTRREPAGERVEIVLDVGNADPDAPSVVRLVEEVGNGVLASTPEAQQVVVMNRDGTELGTVIRVEAPDVPLADTEDWDADARGELRSTRRHRPDPTKRGPSAPPRPSGPDLEFELEPRHLAERFDLPPAVHDELRDDEDPVELLRAILAAAGQPAVVEGDAIRSGDELFIVLPEVHGRPVTEGLNHAYHRFKAAGARAGVVICLGYTSPRECKRREALEPALRHAGPSAIQRMADAVALGADPRRFAVAPSLADNTYIRNTP